jgi:hypothetical protein
MPTTCPEQTRWAVSHGHSWIIATAPDQTTCLAKALLNSSSKLVMRIQFLFLLFDRPPSLRLLRDHGRLSLGVNSFGLILDDLLTIGLA